MCGIAGYIGKKQVGKSVINKTLGLMKNRGPDYQDWCSFIANDTNVYLLHSRLSIIDLDERSNQPFSFNDFNENVIAELKKNNIRCCPTAIDGLNDLTIGSMFYLKRVMVN